MTARTRLLDHSQATPTSWLVGLVLSITLVSAADAYAQAEIRKQFESGQYQQVIDAATPDAEPSVVYMAALSHQKAGAVDQAVGAARRLAELPDDRAWHFVGESLAQLLEDQTDAALESARRAAGMADAPAEAHYQLGLVLARQQEWREAAESFDRVTAADPSNAYGHYYGGLMHYRAGRTDLMAVRFERFLKLAPEAPERPEVMQIMRTMRGR
jgi:tetratricopeptide (TPR) repeat protein